MINSLEESSKKARSRFKNVVFKKLFFLGLILTLVYQKDLFWNLSYFLIYINDLSNDIKSKWKLFAGDTSLFSVVHDIDTSANDLNHDLEKINE